MKSRITRCFNAWTIVLGIVMMNCQEQQEPPAFNEVRFSISTEQLNPDGGRMQEDSNPAGVLVTIRDSNGKVIVEQEKLDLYKFGDQFLSVPLTLSVTGLNHFYVTEFLVVDQYQSVKYVTPRKGSKYGHLVSDPLDIEFSVTEGQITTMNLQVIEVFEGSSVNDFGYGQFGFDVVKIKQAVFSSFIKGSTNFQLTTSHLKIEGLSLSTSDTTLLWTFETDLAAKANIILIKDAPLYRLTAKKAGYKDWSKVSEITSLEAFEIIFEEQSQLPLLKEIIYDEYGGSALSRQVFQYSDNASAPNLVLGYNCGSEMISSCVQDAGHFRNTIDLETRRISVHMFFRYSTDDPTNPEFTVTWEYHPDGKIKIVRKQYSQQTGGGQSREEFFYTTSGRLSHSLVPQITTNPDPVNFNGYVRFYKYGTDGNIRKIDTHRYSVHNDVEIVGYQYASEEHEYDNHPANPKLYSHWYEDGPIARKNNVVWSKFVEYSQYTQNGEVHSRIFREIEATRTYQYHENGLPYKETISVTHLNQPYTMADGTVITYLY